MKDQRQVEKLKVKEMFLKKVALFLSFSLFLFIFVFYFFMTFEYMETDDLIVIFMWIIIKRGDSQRNYPVTMVHIW